MDILRFDRNESEIALLEPLLANHLKEIFVEEGFAHRDLGDELFRFDRITSRGSLFYIYCSTKKQLCGTVLLVEAGSEYAKIAEPNQCEIQLLAVAESFRNKGLGATLMNHVLSQAKERGFEAAVLITQKTMFAAQRLYKKIGFLEMTTERSKKLPNNFLAFSKSL